MAWRTPPVAADILRIGMILSLERYVIYAPERSIEVTPQGEGLDFEDVWFDSSDGVKLHGWLVPAPGARITLLWFHGNGGNIARCLNNLKYLFRRLGVNIFVFDYRGYGRSEGGMFDLSEEATYRDADGALAYLRGRRDLAGTTPVYFGQSLGAAIAVDIARRQPAAGLILETPFTSIRDMARIVAPYWPFPSLLQTKYDSLRKIEEVRVPLLVLHGDHDEWVPYEQGRRLFDAANEPKTLYTIPGAHHNDTYVVGGEKYFEAWAGFLSTLG
ncbi:MAG TPA: alpha/beta fold hydrolase [Candidatus Acidoferrum sp.]|nr:alpha/beta fold hydrolase [Candidatus Acidoferrum sp.]